MRDIGTKNKRTARIATVAFATGTALLAVSFEADSEIASAVFYGGFVASVVNGVAFLWLNLMSSSGLCIALNTEFFATLSLPRLAPY